MRTSAQSPTAQSLIDELRSQGAEHKKLEARNRALAQRSYATAKEIEAFCLANKIPVVRQ